MEYERTIAAGALIAEGLALAPTIPQQCTNRPPRCSQIIRQAGLRTHERTFQMLANRLPTPIEGRSGFEIRRCSFTVAGAAPELLSQRPSDGRRPNAPASRFTRRRSRSHREDSRAPDNFAEDANRRPRDWQGANTPHPLGSLVDNGGGPAMERFFSMKALAQ